MPTIEIEATELLDADVQFVSLVDRGANRIPFRIIKAQSKETPAMTQTQQPRDLYNLAHLFKRDRNQGPNVRKADSSFGTQRPPIPAPAPAPVAKSANFNPAVRLEKSAKPQTQVPATATKTTAAPTSAPAKAKATQTDSVVKSLDTMTKTLAGINKMIRKGDDAADLQDALTTIGTAVETVKSIVGRGIVCQDTADTCRASLETLKADVEALLSDLPAASVSKSDKEFSAFALSPSAWGIRNGHAGRLL